MFTRFLLAIYLFSGGALFASVCDKAKVEDIAREAVVRELKGASLTNKPKCLGTNSFKLVKPIWRPPVEGERILDVGVIDNTLKITKVKKIEDFTGQYEVQYEAEADKLFGGGVRKGKIVIVTKLEPRMRERHGCGMTLIIPETTMLMRSCYEKAIKGKRVQ